jgi:hypothetical protein
MGAAPALKPSDLLPTTTALPEREAPFHNDRKIHLNRNG